MIEAVVIDYLNRGSVPAYAERPEKMPTDPFLLVEKTGSETNDQIYTATIAVQSWAQTMADAAELNETVKAQMKNITALDSISSCRLQTDYNYTTTALKAYRYQAVFLITYYEEEI